MSKVAKISSLFILIVLSSCYEKDVYSDIPRIDFKDVIFYDGDFVDSLVLSFEFEDGNGDIGLSGSAPPFHLFNGIVDSSGRFVLINTPADSLVPPFRAIPIEARETTNGLQYFIYPDLANLFSSEDERTPYNCDDYFIIDTDTLFVSRNIFYNNIYIEFERKVGTDSTDIFVPFDLPVNECESATFNSRIPIFDSNAQKGTIKYNIQSQVLRLTFSDEILRIKFWIYDRGLNQSNIAFTKEFTLQEITQ